MSDLTCGATVLNVAQVPHGKQRPIHGGLDWRLSRHVPALARALINHPKVLLLDEPLGALDQITRMQMQDEILALWQARGTTMVLVTHYIDEAIYMSDRVVIMTPRPGRIERIVDVPLPRPRDRNSAQFQTFRSEILAALHLAESGSSATKLLDRSGICRPATTGLAPVER